MPGGFESFTTTIHSNGKDYWIATPEDPIGNFNLIRTVNGKFDTNIIQHKLPNFSSFVGANSKFSPNSKMLVTHVNEVKDSNGYLQTSFTYLYKFNNDNGNISDSIILEIDEGYRLEFSPNSRFLYIYGKNIEFI